MIFILIILIVTSSDLLIKNHIERYYRNGKEKHILGGLIRIRKLNNYGGFLNYLENHFTILKILSSILILIIAALFAKALPKAGLSLKKAGLSLILGGALSNEYDRYSKGCVTDYFSINLPFIKKIVFNIGDFAIFAGILFSLTGNSKK